MTNLLIPKALHQDRASQDYSLKVNGQEVFTHHTNVASFAKFSFSGSVEIEVTARILLNEKSAVLRPLSKEIDTSIAGATMTFTLDRPENLCLEVNGLNPLFIYALPLDENIPDKDDPNVIYFEPGVHTRGHLTLKSGQTLYLAPGAVLRGVIYAQDQENIRICGHGILDGNVFRRPNYERMLLLQHCKNCTIENITIIDPSCWMIVPGACENITVNRVQEIGETVGGDGCDIVGSKNITVSNCCFRNNDDCVVVKSTGEQGISAGFRSKDCRDNADNILVENCTFWNANGGNAMEVGFELQAEYIKNVSFRNIDVIGSHGEGAVFSIHNGDRATVSNITWEDIRIEHFYDKLIDLRIMNSRWSKDKIRGYIKDVKFKNISCIEDHYNCVSLIDGYDSEHTITGIQISNFKMGDKIIQSVDDFPIYLRYAEAPQIC